ncbi:MAG: hypothetical protein ACK4MY_03400 [Brevundimonas sp.]
MTAVFAYSNGATAFVAADTQRTSWGNVALSAVKVHAWSETVLFAQIGEAQFLTELVGRLLPQRGFLVEGPEGLIEGFRMYAPLLWPKVESSYKAKKLPPPAGTLLVAVADTAWGGPSLFRLDFETGAMTPVLGDTAGDGTTGFDYDKEGADQLVLHTSAGASGGLPLDLWGSACIANAIAASPTTINWPSDQLISREWPRDRILCRRRVGSLIRPNPLFEI